MPANEQEEFEFRLRAEKEAAQSKAMPAQPQSTMQQVKEAAAPSIRGLADIAGFPGDIAYKGQEGIRNLMQKYADMRGYGPTISPMPPPAQQLLTSEWNKQKLADIGVLPRPEGRTGFERGTEMAASALLAAPRAAVGAAREVPALAREAADVSGVSGAARSAVDAMKPTIPPERLELARKAVQEGIPLRPDMLTDNRIMRMVGDVLEKVPLSGSKAAERQTYFNKAVMDKIGADTAADKLTPDVFNKAITQSGEKIGALSEKYPIPVTPDLKSGLDRIVADADFETKDTSRIVRKYVKEINSQILPNGTIDGTAFRKIRSQLTGQMRRTTDGDIKHALSGIDDFMLDHIQSRLSPDELEEFNTARRQYAGAKTIEPMIAKGTGDISPSQLMSRVTSTASGKSAMARGKAGDLGDLARIGQMFLKEPMPGNLPFGATQGALGLGELGGAVVAPGTTATALGAANLYNRLGPNIAKRMVQPPLRMPEEP